MESDASFEQAVQRHDAQVAALGLPLWVGSEPTFTDRLAQTPAWLSGRCECAPVTVRLAASVCVDQAVTVNVSWFGSSR